MTPIASRHPIDWDAYLAGFHTSHPGITEDVLTGSVANGLNPYQWLLDGVRDVRIVDLGCGSGPARPPAATRWTGIDLSAAEIRRAHERGRASLILGQATQLPLADDSVDLITCSMSMMLIHLPHRDARRDRARPSQRPTSSLSVEVLLALWRRSDRRRPRSPGVGQRRTSPRMSFLLAVSAASQRFSAARLSPRAFG